MNSRSVKPLAEVCDFKRGLTYSKSDEVAASSNVVLRATNINLSTNLLDFTELKYLNSQLVIPKTKMISAGSLLICTASGSKSHLGKVAFIDQDYGYAFGGFMGMLTPRSGLSGKYLYYLMISDAYKEFIGKLSDGVNINNLKFEDIKLFPVPLPSLPEQRRIVAILDEAFAGLDAMRANAEKNLQNARDLFDSYLNAILIEKGEGWVEKTLEQVCTIESKLVDPRKSEFLDMPHLGAGNMISKTGEMIDIKTAREEKLISGKFVFDRSMVLYSKIRPYLMKACRPDFTGLCSADVYPLAPKKGQINRDFLFHLLLSDEFTKYAIVGSARAGMPKVNRDHLFAYRTWLPPHDKQVELAKTFDALAIESKTLESVYRQKLADIAELKQSILQKAFSGEPTSLDAVAA